MCCRLVTGVLLNYSHSSPWSVSLGMLSGYHHPLLAAGWVPAVLLARGGLQPAWERLAKTGKGKTLSRQQCSFRQDPPEPPLVGLAVPGCRWVRGQQGEIPPVLFVGWEPPSWSLSVVLCWERGLGRVWLGSFPLQLSALFNCFSYFFFWPYINKLCWWHSIEAIYNSYLSD